MFDSMFYFTFKNETSKSHGIMVTTRPSVPSPIKRGEYVDVAGRDGALFITDGTYETMEIEIPINFVVDSPDNFGSKYREAKSWLSGDGNLIFSDDADWFYKVKECAITSNERTVREGANLVAAFIVDPYQYRVDGRGFISITSPLNNPYAIAKPTYKITGSGDCTLTVNGNAMTMTVATEINIDTDLMIAYSRNGSSLNTSITGDYQDFWLKNGNNTISVTSGFTLTVKPNWRAL